MNEFIVILLICCLDDHTRVFLENKNGFEDSDYINANHLAVSSLQKHSRRKYCFRYATLMHADILQWRYFNKQDKVQTIFLCFIWAPFESL